MKMKILPVLALLASGCFTAVIYAETVPASSAAPVAGVTVSPDRIIYAAQLPSVPTLIKAAAAQGLTIASIDQSNRAIVITYRLTNSQTKTVSYQLLPAESAAPVRVIAQAPTSVVVYASSPAPYYYDSYYAPYYPGVWYPPVYLRFGGRGRGGRRW